MVGCGKFREIPIMINEFHNIEGALKVLAEFVKFSSFERYRFDPLLPVLEFTTAKKLVKVISNPNSEGRISKTEVLKLLTLTDDREMRDAINTLLRWTVPTKLNRIFHPSKFYERASFQFDGQFVRALYFYKCGLGVVLQLGGSVVDGPLDVARAKDEVNTNFQCAGPKFWRLIYIFAGNTVSDGPNWTGYPTVTEARDAYKVAQAAHGKKIAPYLDDGSEMGAGSVLDFVNDVDDDTEPGPTPSSAGIL